MYTIQHSSSTVFKLLNCQIQQHDETAELTKNLFFPTLTRKNDFLKGTYTASKIP
jgi:hypothetical protein